MINYVNKISQRKAGLVAGVGLLLMTILAIFANFFVLESLVVEGDASTTAINIIGSIELFRFGIVSLLIVSILDIIVAWALYILLIPVNKSLSLLAAVFRLIYAGIFAASITYLFSTLELLSSSEYLSVFETNQLHAQAMININAFGNGWNIGIVFFGLHLLLLGYLIYKSGFIHKIIGILVMVASLGYIIDAFGSFLSPNYNLNIGMFTFVGELLFMFWLLFRSNKITIIDLDNDSLLS